MDKMRLEYFYIVMYPEPHKDFVIRLKSSLPSGINILVILARICAM